MNSQSTNLHSSLTKLQEQDLRQYAWKPKKIEIGRTVI